MQVGVRLNSVKAMANRRDVVSAKMRLTLGRLQSALELAQRSDMFWDCGHTKKQYIL